MLSKRETEILSLALLSNKQIARRLNISFKTVERYFSDMLSKFGVKNRTKLLIEAIRAGEVKKIDCGFWNSYGQYVEDWQYVDLRKS